MFEGKVIERTDDHIEVETVFGRLQVAGAAEPGAQVHLSIRPEQVKIGEGGRKGHVSLGKLKVKEVSFFGTHHRCQGRHAKSNQPLIIRLPQNQPAKAGEKIPLAVRRDDIVLLTQ